MNADLTAALGKASPGLLAKIRPAAVTGFGAQFRAR
jgi:hypothetical protein